MHYAHVVEKGSSVEGIASEFEVSGEVLMRVNGIKDPKELLAGQVLDVPLRGIIYLLMVLLFYFRKRFFFFSN